MTGETSEKLSPRTETLDSCPVCASSNTKHFFSAPDRLHGVPGEFSYDRCDNCHTVFQNPMVVPEDLYLCYPSEYAPYNLKIDLPDVDFDSLSAGNFRGRVRKGIVDSVRGKPVVGVEGTAARLLSRIAFFRERAFYGLVIDEMLPKGPGDHFALDLGCGSGWLMQKMNKVGWQTDGVEWNEEAAALARESTGGKVWSGDFRNADIPKNKYELIVLNHVFEHINDPMDALRYVFDFLIPGGRAVLFYPNPGAFSAARFGSYWYAWDPPRHLIFPAAKALRHLALKVGFRQAEVKSRAFYPETQWLNSKSHVLGLKAETDVPKLTRLETVGILVEKLLSVFELGKGWETVGVLRK